MPTSLTHRHPSRAHAPPTQPSRRLRSSFLKKRRFSAGQWTTNLDGVHREIAIMKKLSHANVMTLYDCCMSQNNLCAPALPALPRTATHRPSHERPTTRGAARRYMVMEFCTLGAIMETEKLPCAPLDMRDTRRWFADSVLGLQYLHFQSVVHHDIKPDNILVNSKRAAVISDFGVSRAYGGTSEKGASGTPLCTCPRLTQCTRFPLHPCSLLTDGAALCVVQVQLS
jgi:serine/threonine protein kinase